MDNQSVSNPETWVEEHGDVLYRYALFQVKNEMAAEDLVQETFLAALKAQDKFSQQSALRTWLIGILKHKIADYFQQQWREQPLEELAEQENMDEKIALADFFTKSGHWISPPAAWNHPFQALEQEQFWQILQRCISNLPPKLEHLFTQKEINEVENEKICKELKITVTNLWVMLFRARLQLRQCLEQNWFGKKERK